MQWLGRIAAVSLGHELARIGTHPRRHPPSGRRAPWMAPLSPARTVTG